MASLLARRSINKLLKPYSALSPSSAYASLFSLNARNSDRELGHSPTISSSAPDCLLSGRGKSRASVSPPRAPFDPILKTHLIFGGGFGGGHHGSRGLRRAIYSPISLLDQKSRFSSASGLTPESVDQTVKRGMEKTYSRGKVIVALALIDLVACGWESYLTPGSPISEATVNSCYRFCLTLFAVSILRRIALNPHEFGLLFILIINLTSVYFMFKYLYYVFKSAARLGTVLRGGDPTDQGRA